jgi:hypothetical protein
VGVRWNTVTAAALSAISGIDCTADDPVPTTPTRLPARSGSSWGQRLVHRSSPPKLSSPVMPGSIGTERHPVAITTKRAS